MYNPSCQKKEPAQMKKIFFLLSLLTWSHLSMAALPPVIYAHARSGADEVMTIRTGRVLTYRLRGNRLLVKARAKILHRHRSVRHIRSQWITIRYITKAQNTYKLLGPAPTPVLRARRPYKAYLNRSKRGHYYIPAAGYQSFEPIRRQRKTTHRGRLF
jgi:hypothetical protein